MNEQDMLEPTESKSFPSFNDSKHNILCSELKQLYVAITRTRQRLWICENTEEYCRPMFDYWKRKCLVQFKELDDSLAQAMKVASSPEEWKSRGKKVVFVVEHFIQCAFIVICFIDMSPFLLDCYYNFLSNLNYSYI
jgi:hypothetical protein